jgi:hypothetical protein
VGHLNCVLCGCLGLDIGHLWLCVERGLLATPLSSGRAVSRPIRPILLTDRPVSINTVSIAIRINTVNRQSCQYSYCQYSYQY